MNLLITNSFATGTGFTLALLKERANHTQISWKGPLLQCLTKKERVRRKREGVCKNCFMKIQVIGEQVRERESQTDTERWGGRWWHVDLWAAGLFINHTQIYWNRESGRERETDRERLNWGPLTEREGAGWKDLWRKIEFRGVLLWIILIVLTPFRHCHFPYLSISFMLLIFTLQTHAWAQSCFTFGFLVWVLRQSL